MENSAEDTFVKILNGTNIFDMRMKEGSDDELMSSDFDGAEESRMQSAIANEPGNGIIPTAIKP